ncbi:hypothetical protein [Streptomyces sp. NPDC086777]|uniref:hypothetical protein n=1 Tax=Streptomyces sp. NPDC086777 TaxID=3154866 RepID=UPI00344DA2D3
MARGVSGTALVTAAAVMAGLVQATPAKADSTEEDTGYYRSSVGETVRLDRCLAGVALHYGGANMKAKAVEGLSGTAAQLRDVVGDVGWIGFGPLGQAGDTDKEASLDYRDASNARTDALEAANKPYVQSAYASDDMQWHAPAFDADVRQFTLFTQEELAGRLGWDGHSNASAEAVARAREITEENNGKDSWNDFAAADMLRDTEVKETRYSRSTTASDIASYLKHSGLLTQAPAEGTAEYRVLVEDLKQAWAQCDSQNPVDIRRVLNGPVLTAMAEWETEYAAQAAPRSTIIKAEADAATATRAATDDMIEAIGQAWLAEQILTWRKYWQDKLAADPDSLNKPDQALYDQADADLAEARDNVAALVTSAETEAGKAAEAATKASTAQQTAWAIADTDNVPRGRGLMYAQQSVQVARASGAAAEAAAKATRTALEAANATVADSDTLLAKAQTQSHAVNTEFRRIAAQEAAAQAKRPPPTPRTPRRRPPPTAQPTPRPPRPPPRRRTAPRTTPRPPPRRSAPRQSWSTPPPWPPGSAPPTSGPRPRCPRPRPRRGRRPRTTPRRQPTRPPPPRRTSARPPTRRPRRQPPPAGPPRPPRRRSRLRPPAPPPWKQPPRQPRAAPPRARPVPRPTRPAPLRPPLPPPRPPRRPLLTRREPPPSPPGPRPPRRKAPPNGPRPTPRARGPRT